PQARMNFHQTHSGPVMNALQDWLAQQFALRKVEPNSGLGQAIAYMTKHWQPLTLFLRNAGAPLDNNACYAAGGISLIMPTAGLCRFGGFRCAPVMPPMVVDAA
ncbi:MAG: transposase, partial [Hyphomicrobiales bacterium]|nr:transposase [Hyphomicrobiales bacterium]